MPPARRITLVWLLLLAATAVSWALGRERGGVDGAGAGAGSGDGGVTPFHDARDFGVVILVLAFFKIRLVLLDFMELRGAPLPMRYVAEAWVFALAAAILVIYRL
jgi:hypothetical protein